MNAGLSCIRGFYIKHLSASVGIITGLGLDYFGICRTKKNVRWKWPFRTYWLQSNLISEETHGQLKGQQEGNKMQAFRNEHLLRCISPLIRPLNVSRLHRPTSSQQSTLLSHCSLTWVSKSRMTGRGFRSGFRRQAQTLDQVSVLCCYILKLFGNMHSCTEYLCFVFLYSLSSSYFPSPSS